jgi:hypothetical protein
LAWNALCLSAGSCSGIVRMSWLERGTGVWSSIGRRALAALVSVLAVSGIFPATASAIVGGQEVAQEYPWAVVVEHSRGACSGALISPRWVLTAGHCIVTDRPGQAESDPGLDNPLRPADDFRLFIGSTVRYEGESRRANRLVKGPRGLDVGLIELDQASDKAPIQVAARMMPRSGQEAVLVGWGQVCEAKDCALATTLKQLSLRLAAPASTSSGNPLLTWPEDDPGQRAAKGDSGGPVIFQNNGRWELIGTLSGSGTTGDSSALKGLATNVSTLHNWLDATAATTTPEADIWTVEFVLVLVLGVVVVIVVFRAFRRSRRRRRPVTGPAAPVQRARDEDLEYMEQWALQRTGVEAYYEPGTATIVATVMLIAGDGEWTRRKIGSLEGAIRFGNQRGIPVYEVFRTGYPQRKRDYDEQSRRSKTRG